MALAGKAAKAQVCATEGGTYYDIAGINSISFAPSFEKLDTTHFAATAGTDDYAGAVTRMAGLTDIDCSLDGDWLSTDTNGQTVLQARAPGGGSAGSTCWIKILPIGGTPGSGWRFEALVEYDMKIDPKGKVEVTYKLTCTSKVQADNAA